jgi:long-subunit acyl-CoA synthetase (AMP-forming)
MGVAPESGAKVFADAGCGNCHTPRDDDANFNRDMNMAGAYVIEEPEFISWAPNITPDPETGIGEVWAQGPTLMSGYLDDPQQTSEVLVDGWLKTGDLGWLDAADHLHLVGRSKNMIVTAGGKNIYPEDIENALRVAGIRDSVVLETRPGRIEAILLEVAAVVVEDEVPAARGEGQRQHGDHHRCECESRHHAAPLSPR